jgi:nucleoside-diphosphate-sugar epimerase
MTGPVLVTGAAGFLGAQIIRALLDRRIPAVALVRQRRRAWRLSGLSDLVVVEAEMTIPDTIVRAIEIAQPSTIINAASYGVNHGERDMDAMVEVNVTAVHQLLKAALARGARRLIQLGTYSEYGDHPLLTEDTPLHPKNAYGATKAAASLIVSSSEIARDLDTAVLRLFNIWGPMEGRNRLIPAVIRHCQTRKPLNLTSGRQAKDYSFAPDLAQWIVDFACYPEAYPFRWVNFASGRMIMVRDLVLAVARALGGEDLMRFGAKSTPPGEVQTGPPDTTRIERLLPNRKFTELPNAVAQMLASPEAPGTKEMPLI